MKFSILMEIVEDIDFFFGQTFTVITGTMLQFSQEYKILILDVSQPVDVIDNQVTYIWTKPFTHPRDWMRIPFITEFFTIFLNKSKK